MREFKTNNLPDNFVQGISKIVDSVFSAINVEPEEDVLTFDEFNRIMNLRDDFLTAENHLRNIKNMNYEMTPELETLIDNMTYSIDQFNEYMFKAETVDKDYEEF